MDEPDFQQLQAEWYQRLKESGFEDIETPCNGGMRLKNEHRRLFRSRGLRNRDMWQSTFIVAKISYYLNFTQKVNDPETKFKRELDRIVLTMHSDGFTKVDIVKFLKAFGYIRDRRSVAYIIRRYENEWGLKKYNLKQLNKRPRKVRATA